MKSQIIDCFDSDIQNRIMRINEKLKSISPDNVRYLDSSIIEMNNKLDALNFLYAGDCMINSVSVDKLNSLLSKSKSRIMQFKAISKLGVDGTDDSGNPVFIPLNEYLGSVADKLTEIEIRVPESYSGLQSFIITHPDPIGREKYAVDKKKKFWYYKEEETIKFHFLRYNVTEIYVLFWK